MYCNKNNCSFDECGSIKKDFSTKYFDSQMCEDCCSGRIVRVEGNCCKAPNIIHANIPRVDGVPLKRMFCTNCGYKKQMKMSHSNEWKELPLIPLYEADELMEKASKKERAFYDYCSGQKKQLHEKNTRDFQEKYSEYLKSEKWMELRSVVLDRDEHLCQGCLKEEATQVHHLTYENVFNELAFQLISVCKDCHNKIHED